MGQYPAKQFQGPTDMRSMGSQNNLVQQAQPMATAPQNSFLPIMTEFPAVQSPNSTRLNDRNPHGMPDASMSKLARVNPWGDKQMDGHGFYGVAGTNAPNMPTSYVSGGTAYGGTNWL